MQVPGQIVQSANTPRSYLVYAPSGQVRRNHRDLRVRIEESTDTKLETGLGIITTCSCSEITVHPPISLETNQGPLSLIQVKGILCQEKIDFKAAITFIEVIEVNFWTSTSLEQQFTTNTLDQTLLLDWFSYQVYPDSCTKCSTKRIHFFTSLFIHSFYHNPFNHSSICPSISSFIHLLDKERDVDKQGISQNTLHHEACQSFQCNKENFQTFDNDNSDIRG